MVKRFHFSIRYKLLILLCFLTTTVLTIFLLLSIDLFKKDKTAYIFDSSASFSRGLAGNVRSEIVNTTEKINILLSGLNQDEWQFNENSQQIFKRFTQLQFVWLIEYQEESFQKLASLQKEGNYFLDDTYLQTLVDRINANSVYISPYDDKGKWILGITYPTGNESKKVYIVVLIEALELTKNFQSDQSTDSFLLDEAGNLVIKSKKVTSQHIELFTNSSFFEKIGDNFLPEGTAEITLPGETTQLVSYQRVGEGKLLIITEVSKEKAFQTVNILFIKSALFFVALIALSIIFAVIFSNSLTSALGALTMAVDHIAAGNFDVTVESRTHDEVGILSDGVNIMVEKISQLLSELEQYSKNLELMVEERTRELKEANILIKTMIDSLGQGLLVFNEEGKCLPLFTNACLDLFAVSPKEKNIWEVLKVSEEDRLKHLRKWIIGIFKQLIPFNDMAKLGPSSIEGEGGKYIALEYRPMMNEDEEMLGVVMVATDKTEEQLAKKEAQKNLEYSQMVIKIVRNRGSFLNFIHEAEDLIVKLHQLVAESENKKEFDLVKAKLYLHSLKGSAGVYSLGEMQRYVHSCESELDEYKNRSVEELIHYLPTLTLHLNKIGEIFKHYLEEFTHFLGESIRDGKYRIEVIHEELKRFSLFLQQETKDSKLYHEFVNSFVKLPIITFFKGYSDVVVDLASRRGKQVNPIQFIGGELRVDKDFYSEFFTVIVHAFTNAVDHGIEEIEVRKGKNKQPAGNISVSFSDQIIGEKRYLKILIDDDGKGIDPQKIREKLLKNGVPPEKVESDDFAVIQHIFDESFSTAEQVSLTSGRGVGTGAIKEVVTRLGGVATVSSEVDHGTRFLIILPYV